MRPKLPHRTGLLDTSVFVAIEQGRELDFGSLPTEQYVSTITRGELVAGIHATKDSHVRADRLATMEALAGLTMLTIDSAAASHWGRLRHAITAAGKRPNVNDLWIASIALAHDLPVITQDRDFELLSDLGGPPIIYV